MSDVQISEREGENNYDEIVNSKKILMELLNSYSYAEICEYLLNEEKQKANDELKLKLKEIVDNISDIDQLAKLLNDGEIVKNTNNLKNENENENENNNNKIISIKEESDLKLENDLDKNIKKRRKPRKKPELFVSKIMYRKNDGIYIYRYITKKKGDNVLLRCQDKYCKSKACYNFSSKEINIYEGHSVPIKSHIYLKNKSPEFIKDLVNYMNINPSINYVEIYSDSSKKIIDYFKETNFPKKQNINPDKLNSLELLNKKRENEIKFSINLDMNSKNNSFPVFKTNKMENDSNLNAKKKPLFETKLMNKDIEKEKEKEKEAKESDSETIEIYDF